ncbi:hypothetical protein [Proteus columbae]|uniref:hypothetical protein n=2 Tax=Proteus TaxID=583 RepID=UPI00288AD2E2|nr:hypothetical protein [Proteus columbae]
MNNFNNQRYPNDKYPRLSSPAPKRNFKKALAHAIASIEGEILKNSPSIAEQRLAMTLWYMNLDASKNHPPLPEHIRTQRDSKRTYTPSNKFEVDYYGSDRRQGQYLGD